MALFVNLRKGWWTLLGWAVVTLVGGKQQEREDKKRRDLEKHRYSFKRPGDPRKHVFIGTPEEAKRFQEELTRKVESAKGNGK